MFQAASDYACQMTLYKTLNN